MNTESWSHIYTIEKSSSGEFRIKQTAREGDSVYWHGADNLQEAIAKIPYYISFDERRNPNKTWEEVQLD